MHQEYLYMSLEANKIITQLELTISYLLTKTFLFPTAFLCFHSYHRMIIYLQLEVSWNEIVVILPTILSFILYQYLEIIKV